MDGFDLGVSLMAVRFIVVLFLSLFHHTHKPPSDIQAFIDSSVAVVRSYEDDSINEDYERGMIVQVECDIYQLSQNKPDDKTNPALMTKINNELKALHAYDEALQESETI